MPASFTSTLPTQSRPEPPPATATPPWSAHSAKTVYENPWTTVREEALIGPQGQTGLYGFFAPVDCVVVVPLWVEEKLLHTALVEQWRQPIREFSWEVPCGRIEAGESIEVAANRELAEECGFQAGELISLGTWRHSDARVAGIIHCFAAVDLALASHLTKDDSEADLSAFRLSWTQALAAIDSGAVNQVASMSALLRCASNPRVKELFALP